MPYRNICVAVALQRYLDFTPVAVRQQALALLLAREHDAKVRLLSVDAPVALLPEVESTDDKLERYAEPFREAGVDVFTSRREGRPSREIIRFVEEVGADLLIMGSHSKRGPLDVGLGSTAIALPVDFEVPVLLVRPTQAEQERTGELMIPRYPFIFPYG
jgi:nucleotide-binding universal stress UspA family protein